MTLRIALLTIVLLLSGCFSSYVPLGASSDLSSVDLGRGRRLEASASGFQLLLLIPLRINSRLERAMESIREQAGGEMITDIKVSESWTYGFVGTLYTTTVEATSYPRAG